MPTATAHIYDEARELVRQRGLDPLSDARGTRTLIDEVIGHYEERVATSALPPLLDRDEAARFVFDQLAGFGQLQQFLDDPAVEEIWVNEPGRVFVARHGRSELTTVVLTASELRDLVERMLKPSRRRLDLSSPFVDADVMKTTGPCRVGPASFTGERQAWPAEKPGTRRALTDSRTGAIDRRKCCTRRRQSSGKQRVRIVCSDRYWRSPPFGLARSVPYSLGRCRSRISLRSSCTALIYVGVGHSSRRSTWRHPVSRRWTV